MCEYSHVFPDQFDCWSYHFWSSFSMEFLEILFDFKIFFCGFCREVLEILRDLTILKNSYWCPEFFFFLIVIKFSRMLCKFLGFLIFLCWILLSISHKGFCVDVSSIIGPVMPFFTLLSNFRIFFWDSLELFTVSEIVCHYLCALDNE